MTSLQNLDIEVLSRIDSDDPSIHGLRIEGLSPGYTYYYPESGIEGKDIILQRLIDYGYADLTNPIQSGRLYQLTRKGREALDLYRQKNPV